MKSQKIFNLVISFCSVVVALLLIVSYLVPLLSYGTSASGFSIYLLEVGSVNISGYSSSAMSGASNVTINFFYSILILCSGLIGCFLSVMKTDKKVVHFVGETLLLSNVIFALFIHQNLQKELDSLASSGVSNVHRGGEIVYFLFAILGFALSVVCFLDDMFGDRVRSLVSSSSTNKEKRLSELKGLFDKQLITQQEYDSKREEILNEKE